MEKRFILAIVLTIAVIYAFSAFGRHPAPVQQGPALPHGTGPAATGTGQVAKGTGPVRADGPGPAAPPQASGVRPTVKLDPPPSDAKLAVGPLEVTVAS